MIFETLKNGGRNAPRDKEKPRAARCQQQGGNVSIVRAPERNGGEIRGAAEQHGGGALQRSEEMRSRDETRRAGEPDEIRNAAGHWRRAEEQRAGAAAAGLLRHWSEEVEAVPDLQRPQRSGAEERSSGGRRWCRSRPVSAGCKGCKTSQTSQNGHLPADSGGLIRSAGGWLATPNV